MEMLLVKEDGRWGRPSRWVAIVLDAVGVGMSMRMLVLLMLLVL